jgi:choline-glycine betaine transporter
LCVNSKKEEGMSGASEKPRSYDPLVFWVSASLTILFVLWSAVFPDSMESVVNSVFAWTTEGWGWLYLFLTSANSAALALAMFVTGKETRGRNMRAFWGIGLGAVAAVLAATGSLKVIQTASIATAFPLMFLLLLVLWDLSRVGRLPGGGGSWIGAPGYPPSGR